MFSALGTWDPSSLFQQCSIACPSPSPLFAFHAHFPLCFTVRASDFDFVLPPELIAQRPACERDQSRLLVLHRDSGKIAHRTFAALLANLRPGAVLVLNDSKVIAPRLHGPNSA